VFQPIPVPCAHDQEFWAAAKSGTLLLQRSVTSGKLQTYPRAHALDGSAGVEWVESKGYGHIHTFSVVHRSFYEALQAPYVIAVVELEEGVKFVGHLVESSPETIEVGMSVEITFRDLNSEIALPCFRPRAR
jgi:uncharacterized OB-fold protein